MFAKSISEISPGARVATPLHWTRKMLTLAVFFASVTALALLLHERHGAQWLESAYAAVESEAKAVSDRVLAPPQTPVAHRDAARHAALAEFLAKRYKVSQDVTLEFVQIAHAEGRQLGMDPLLIMAVIAIESRYNPIAESEVGAKGLMQIIPKFHGDKLAKFGGEKAVFDPASNIRVGTRILREYLSRTGNLSIALQMYAGALGDTNDTYTTKVLGEKQRLQRVVAAFAEPATGAIRIAHNAQQARETRRIDSPLGE
ncbi:MAG: transglycosylase SLT domain-containing protein [Burkholderiales bacterium]|nr:transglycosylase SLT domain-containing protein [Burkholderiales bacterium]